MLCSKFIELTLFTIEIVLLFIIIHTLSSKAISYNYAKLRKNLYKAKTQILGKQAFISI
ncbi:hypothetical protein HMPREF3202_00464 [Prevotella bivia]|uniref:Uncharacterized protein n=1 Tax=Prevotella bivia TaxID=28125 RepID=A0A137SZY3_9BACT|nr:hypothetical protein HMPREF3202_00464 [Prevotella bivia]